MVIKGSSAREIDALLGDLASDVAVKRDAAVARLTVIGTRAVERLIKLAAATNSPSAARVAAFRSLEGISDARSLEPALKSFSDPDTAVVIAALNIARALLRTPVGVKALDHLTAVALDRQRPASVRLTAIDALSDLPAATVKPILDALKTDPDLEISGGLHPGRRTGVRISSTDRLQAAANGTLGDAAGLRRAMARASADVEESTLQHVIDRVRIREGMEAESARASWMAVRGAAHAALGKRGSRIALYDLRETIETAREPVPGEFLAALAAIGDASCLEPIAAAYAHSASGKLPDDWWRRHLADAFHAIVVREQITRRDAVMKRIEKRWKGIVQSLVVSR